MKQKFKKAINMISKPTYAYVAAITLAEEALAASGGTAIEVTMVKNLGATAKSLLQGDGAYIIDGLILAAGAYTCAMAKSPAPMVFAIISCGVFHLGVNLLLK